MSKLNDRTDLDDTDEPEDTEDTPRKKDRKTFRNTKYRGCMYIKYVVQITSILALEFVKIIIIPS